MSGLPTVHADHRPGGVWRRRGTYYVLGSLGVCAHLFLARPIYTMVDRLLACALLIIALLVARRFVVARRLEPPIMALISLQFYTMYALPQFTQEAFLIIHGPFTPSPRAVSLAMLLATLASAGCWIAYELARGRVTSERDTGGRGVFPEVRLSWRKPALLYMLLCLALEVWELAVPDSVPLAMRNMVAKVFNPLLAVTLLLFIGYRLRDSVSRRVAGISIITLSLIGLVGSALVSIVVPIYLYFMAKWLWAGRLNMRWATIGVVLFLLLNPVKAQYRQAVFHGEAVSDFGDLISRLDLWRSALIDTYMDPLGTQRSIETSASRTSGLLEFGQVIDWTPEIVSYQYGKGFSTALLFWVPRAVWPAKPTISELVNNRYAVEFHITTPEGIRRSTFGMRQPADGYWDFGFAGALIYPIMFGTLIGTIFRSGRGPSFLIVSLVFSAEFFQTLANLQYIVASVVTLLVGSLIAMKAIELAARGREVPLPGMAVARLAEKSDS